MALAIAAVSFAYYYPRGMTTAHYDAKAHLVVARRVLDAASPGYAQLGSHWLPLTHFLYIPMVAFDLQYRTGFLPSVVSVLCFALSAWLVFRIGRRVTESETGGVMAAAFLALNQNLQYLACCPLTEPLFMVLMLAATDSFMLWREGDRSQLPVVPAAWVSLSALCRYEGWHFLAGVCLVLLVDRLQGRTSTRDTWRAALAFGCIFALPVTLHFGYVSSRNGESFFHRVARGQVGTYETWRRPFLSIWYHIGELAQIAGVLPLAAGLTGTVLVLSRVRRETRWLPVLALWLPSLTNVAALYWGLIYRVRYSVLLLPAIALSAAALACSRRFSRPAAVGAGLLTMILPWVPWWFPDDWQHHFVRAGPGVMLLPVLGLVAVALSQVAARSAWLAGGLCIISMWVPGLSGEVRPILDETREHAFLEAERQPLLEYLRANYDGKTVLVDIEKLAPLVYDSGVPLRNLVYGEGDLTRWSRALANPSAVADWIWSIQGDEFSRRLRVDPHWADGYALAWQSEYFRVYRRRPAGRSDPLPAGRPE